MILPGLRKAQVFTSPTRSHLRVEKPGMMEYGSHGNPIVLRPYLLPHLLQDPPREGRGRKSRQGMDGEDNRGHQWWTEMTTGTGRHYIA